MELVLLIVVIVLALWVSRLAQRIETLKERLLHRPITKNSLDPIPTAPPRPISPASAVTPVSLAALTHDHAAASSFTPAGTTHPTTPADTDTEFFLYTWFKEHSLIKIGSIIFFFGAVWFVSYAIEQNWISPLTRITLGVALAMGTYWLAVWRSAVSTVQFQVLTILGSGIAFATMVAAQFAFAVPVLPSILSLLIMLGAVAFTVFTALRTHTEWLAITAGVAGLVAPLLIRVAEPNTLLLLSYVFVLAAGFLTVAFFTNWRMVALTQAIGASIFLLTAYTALSDTALWLFVVTFSLLFLASTLVSLWRSQTLLLAEGLLEYASRCSPSWRHSHPQAPSWQRMLGNSWHSTCWCATCSTSP